MISEITWDIASPCIHVCFRNFLLLEDKVHGLMLMMLIGNKNTSADLEGIKLVKAVLPVHRLIYCGIQ